MDEAAHPPRRTYKVKIGDQIEVEVATEDEVISLLRAAGLLDLKGHAAQPSTSQQRRYHPTRGTAFANFLRHLQNKKRLPIADCPELLGLKGTKGLSPFLAAWGRYYADMGLQLDRIIVRIVDRARHRWLEPGPDIEAGIEAAESAPS